MTKRTPQSSRRKPRSTVERTYRKIVIAFSISAAILIAFVIYFSLSKTTITVATRPQEVSSSFTVAVQGGAPAENTTDILQGELIEVTQERDGAYTDLTSVGSKEVKAEGEVTIMNATKKPQPLVATTRLLSESGVLFRTQETITVPAGGEVNVKVAADQPGEEGAIPPQRFTIVALWKGLQDQIYGRSARAMTLGARDITVATEDDIRKAKQENLAALQKEALQKLEETMNSTKRGKVLHPDALSRAVLEEHANAKPDARVDSITVTTSARFTAVLFDEQELLAVAMIKLQEKRDENMAFVPVSADALSYSVESIDREKNTAHLKVTITGSEKPMLTHPMFDRARLTGKNADEIQSYLLGFKAVADVDIVFSPFWAVRSPSLPDHISLILQ